MANLTVDIGNSRIKLGLFEGNVLSHSASFLYDQEDVLMKWISDRAVDASVLSSVQREDHPLVQRLMKALRPFRFDGRSPLPVVLHYQTPETLGQDRIAALCGARSIYPGRDLLIVNAGSCITYDLLTGQGIFEGGNIAPGMKMRWRAMHEFTGRLQMVDSSGIDFSQLLGRNTEEALALGVIQGIAAEIETYFSHLQLKYPELSLVMSGGDAVYLSSLAGRELILEPNLVLYGLNEILQYQ